ncbi:MAG TPA: hypothetical protein PK760_12590, partial [Flavobacteriales bacterium]|nr:hypothetical protein [Flavobacteriales bacterium]
DGFFDRFPQMVQARIAEQEKRGLSGWFSQLSISVRAGIATASIACIGAIMFLALPTEAPPVIAQQPEVMIDPVEIDMEDLDDPELIAMLPADEPLMQHSAVNDLSDDELTAYIENEEIPEDLLLEEL